MMTPTELHLALNHFPLLGAAIAVALFGWALLARSRDLTKAAFVLTLACGIAGFIAKQSGESAEEQVEHLPWANEELIHEHEEAGEWAFYLLGLAGLGAAAGLVRMRGGKDARVEAMIVMALTVVAFAVTAKTALEGGRIRHEEIRPGFVFPAQGSDD